MHGIKRTIYFVLTSVGLFGLYLGVLTDYHIRLVSAVELERCRYQVLPTENIQEFPQASAQLVAWMQYRSTPSSIRDIMVYDIATGRVKNIAEGSTSYLLEDAWENQILLSADGRLYIYNHITGIKSEISPQSAGKSNASLHGQTIVWSQVPSSGGNAQIFASINGTVTQISNNLQLTHIQPQTDSQSIVWTAYSGAQSSIFLYSIAQQSTKQLPTSQPLSSHPYVSGDYAVWQETFPNDIGIVEDDVRKVYIYTISTNRKDLLLNLYYPRSSYNMSGSFVVMADNSSVYVYNLGTKELYDYTYSIDTTINYINPDVSGLTLAWKEEKSGINKVYANICNPVTPVPTTPLSPTFTPTRVPTAGPTATPTMGIVFLKKLLTNYATSDSSLWDVYPDSYINSLDLVPR